MRDHSFRERSLFAGSIKGLAIVGGLIAAFFITPGLYDWTEPLILAFTLANYGAEWIDGVAFLWFCLVGAGVFFAVAAGLSMVTMAAGLAVASFLR